MATITAELMSGDEKRDTRGRRIAARERRAQIVAAFAASGMTQRAFARREGVNANTLARWVWLSRRAPLAKPAAAAALRFAEGKFPLAASAWLFEIALPNGCVVRAATASAAAELLGLTGR
jgi:transposase-like protein